MICIRPLIRKRKVRTCLSYWRPLNNLQNNAKIVLATVLTKLKPISTEEKNQTLKNEISTNLPKYSCPNKCFPLHYIFELESH